jgi:hypothetical protein
MRGIIGVGNPPSGAMQHAPIPFFALVPIRLVTLGIFYITFPKMGVSFTSGRLLVDAGEKFGVWLGSLHQCVLDE